MKTAASCRWRHAEKPLPQTTEVPRNIGESSGKRKAILINRRNSKRPCSSASQRVRKLRRVGREPFAALGHHGRRNGVAPGVPFECDLGAAAREQRREPLHLGGG